MKKLITLMLCITSFASIANAKTIYVNSTTGSDSNSGLTWETALKSIPYALTVTSPSGDNLWIAGGTYVIPGTSTFTQGNGTGMYGGFSGNEAYLSSRPNSDLDGNGIVEPWEFTNATVLTFNVTDKSAITFTGAAFNGFTLSASATLNDNQSACVYTMNDWTNFVNNTIKNNHLTFSVNTDHGGYYPFFKASGTVNNCLFEKNTVTVTATQFAYICPFITVNASYHNNKGTKFLNSVIRNNTVTVDYSTAASGINSYGARALIMNVQGGMNPTTATGNKGGLPTKVANCIIHNNEMIYIPGSAAGQLFDAATIVTGTSINYWDGNANVKQPTTDSIINCTIANNKGTRINNCGINIMSDVSSYHYIINNVFYNNQRAIKGTNYQVSNMAQNNTQNAGLISNNFTDGEGLSNNSKQVVKQDNTLGTGSNLPDFKNPTTAIGTTSDNSSEVSNWTLTAGSYLIGKGIATTQFTDKAGVAFTTSRAIGAYEYKGSN